MKNNFKKFKKGIDYSSKSDLEKLLEDVDTEEIFKEADSISENLNETARDLEKLINNYTEEFKWNS